MKNKYAHTAGKGDKPRAINKVKFDRNFDRIFPSRRIVPGKTRIVYK